MGTHWADPTQAGTEDARDSGEQVGAVRGWAGISAAPSSGTGFLCHGCWGERRREMELRNFRLRGLFSLGRARTGEPRCPGPAGSP